jgi:hypothetical protein
MRPFSKKILKSIMFKATFQDKKVSYYADNRSVIIFVEG